MIKHPQFLKSTLFWFGLVLLVLNDHIFKAQFSNEFTGKFSDFLGLLIFPIFLTVFSSKSITANCIAAGMVFILWNSPLATPLIDVAHRLGIPFHRTIDITDLSALVVLPISYVYIKSVLNTSPTLKKPLLHSFLVVTSFIALSATTIKPQYERSINKNYVVHATKHQILSEIEALNCELISVESTSSNINSYKINNLVMGTDSILKTAYFSITEKKNRCILRVTEVTTFDGYMNFFYIGHKAFVKKKVKKYFMEEIK